MDDILKRFNLSYSMWSTYKESQLQFYFQYIKRPEASNATFEVYGRAGNAVHDALEEFLKTGEDNFHKYWLDRKVDLYRGIRGAKLVEDKYRVMFETGLTFIEELRIDHLSSEFTWQITAERKLEIQLYGIKVKGFIDLEIENTTTGEIYIKDWKTNSSPSEKLHKDQRLFYSWLYWKILNIIPHCDWYYLKTDEHFYSQFNEEDMKAFDIKIKYLLQDIVSKGFDIENYEAGNYKGIFNAYKNLCEEENYTRLANTQSIVFEIKGHYVFIKSLIDPQLEAGLDFATKFDLPNKYFMQEKVRQKIEAQDALMGVVGRKPNLDNVGTVHLYNSKFKCFPIGLLDKMKTICQEYSDYYNKHLAVVVNDYRDQKIMDTRLGYYDGGVPNNIRPYQRVAMRTFLDKQMGIINIATGGGKTFTAGCIIGNLNAKTLWIIDRKELLHQTKEALEKQLGLKLGIISGGEVDIQDITIATIQSLHSKIDELTPYLTTVNFVIVDEFHKSAAETYQKVFAKLANTKYKLGLTATPKRDDGKDPILFSILGGIIYKKTTKELIDEGYLVKPNITFYEMPTEYAELSDKKSYPEDYKDSISENLLRNDKIIDICFNNQNKKTIILTKQVQHGKELKDRLNKTSFIICEHIHGKATNREDIYKKFTKGVSNVLIMTISIGAEGLDIPDLDIIINASANKGDTKSIQILGRVLRTFKNKDSAEYIDFLDSGYHTKKHSQARIKALKSQGHEVTVTTLDK